MDVGRLEFFRILPSVFGYDGRLTSHDNCKTWIHVPRTTPATTRALYM